MGRDRGPLDGEYAEGKFAGYMRSNANAPNAVLELHLHIGCHLYISLQGHRSKKDATRFDVTWHDSLYDVCVCMCVCIQAQVSYLGTHDAGRVTSRYLYFKHVQVQYREIKARA